MRFFTRFIQYSNRTQKLSLGRHAFAILIFCSLLSSSLYAFTDEECDKACVREQTMREVANDFATAMNREDTQAVANFFNFKSIADKVSKVVASSPRDQRSLYKGIMQAGAKTLSETLLSSLKGKNSPTWFLRILKEDGDNKPLLRIDIEDGGHEYLLLTMNELGTQINDIYFASSGSLYTAQLEDAARLMIKPNKSVLKNLFSGLEVDDETIDIFAKVGKLRRNQEFQKAYTLLKTASPEVQTSKTGLLLAILLSQHVSDEAYFKELELLGKYHSDNPDLQFMLVDYYTITEQYDKAILALESVQNRFGADGALFNLQANLRYAQNRTSQAVILSKKAIDIEYDFEESYWTLATIQNENERYAELADTMNLLVDIFGYQFKRENFENDDFYKSFAQTPEFDAWIEQHVASRTETNE